jgi:hypothetical protein
MKHTTPVRKKRSGADDGLSAASFLPGANPARFDTVIIAQSGRRNFFGKKGGTTGLYSPLHVNNHLREGALIF